MFKQSTAVLLFLFVFFQIATQCATVATASATENFYWKSSYTRGVGSNPSVTSTAACGAGLERGAVMSEPFTIHGEKAGAFLCYPVCKTGYKGTGPVCWQDPPPVTYVSCAAGIAASQTVCDAVAANQIITLSTLGMAVASLASSRSSTGEKVADVMNTSRSEAEAALKSPKIYEDGKKLAEALLPLAKSAGPAVKAELKSFASGVEGAPTMAKNVSNEVAAGLSAAQIQKLAKIFKAAVLGSKITIRVGSIMYNAMNDTNTTPLDYARDTAGLASYAFAIYEMTHPEDKVPAGTLFGAVSAFMYPTYGVTY